MKTNPLKKKIKQNNQLMSIHNFENTQNSHNYSQQIQLTDSLCRRIDFTVGMYYEVMGEHNYFDNPHFNGRFRQFVQQNHLFNCNIQTHLRNGNPKSSKFSEFDVDNFPLHPSWATNDTNRKHSAIFYVLQYCSIFNRPPSPKYIKMKLDYEEISSDTLHHFEHALLNCLELQTLETLMRKYKFFVENPSDKSHEFTLDFIDNILLNINSVTTNYMYLHQFGNSNSGKDFQLLYLVFGFCDHTKCRIFNRHQRSMSQIINNQKKKRDIYLLDYVRTNEAKLSNDEENSVMFVFKELDKLHVYFQHRFDHFKSKPDASLPKPQVDDVNPESRSRFSQLAFGGIRFKTNNRPESAELVYQYGVKFKYGYDDEDKFDDKVAGAISVRPKFKSLKDELLNNFIQTVGIKDFEMVQKRAAMIQATEYATEMGITMSNMLTIMFYCNFDALQYAFSKTYRKMNEKETDTELMERHQNFYYFGKYLKLAVQKCGKSMKHTLFHGIGVHVRFPICIGDIQFHGTLSTSTDYVVAINFSQSRGMVIELRDAHGFCKGLEVAFFSDYVNEREVLLVQSEFYLKFRSIIVVPTGHNYVHYISALNLIDQMVKTANMHKLLHDMSAPTYAMANKILSHQLHKLFPNDDQYSTFNGMPTYVEHLANTYFVQQTHLNIDYGANVLRYFFTEDVDYEWIKLDLITALFPNIHTVTIQNTNLCSAKLDYLAGYLQYNINTKLKQLIITNINDHNGIIVASAISQFTNKFKNVRFKVGADENYNGCLFIERENQIIPRNVQQRFRNYMTLKHDTVYVDLAYYFEHSDLISNLIAELCDWNRDISNTELSLYDSIQCFINSNNVETYVKNSLQRKAYLQVMNRMNKYQHPSANKYIKQLYAGIDDNLFNKTDINNELLISGFLREICTTVIPIEIIHYCLIYAFLPVEPSNNDVVHEHFISCDEISLCSNLRRLEIAIDAYTKFMNNGITDIDQINVELILNDFLHLVHFHDNIADFDYIYSVLKKCQFTPCCVFSRNYMDRSNDNEEQMEKYLLHFSEQPALEINDLIELTGDLPMTDDSRQKLQHYLVSNKSQAIDMILHNISARNDEQMDLEKYIQTLVNKNEASSFFSVDQSIVKETIMFAILLLMLCSAFCPFKHYDSLWIPFACILITYVFFGNIRNSIQNETQKKYQNQENRNNIQTANTFEYLQNKEAQSMEMSKSDNIDCEFKHNSNLIRHRHNNQSIVAFSSLSNDDINPNYPMEINSFREKIVEEIPKIQPNISSEQLLQTMQQDRNNNDNIVFKQFHRMVKSIQHTRNEKKDKFVLYQQIMDKIHCFYLHCFDQGFKLTKQERIKLSNIISEEVNDDSG
eukprot:445949_1